MKYVNKTRLWCAECFTRSNKLAILAILRISDPQTNKDFPQITFAAWRISYSPFRRPNCQFAWLHWERNLAKRNKSNEHGSIRIITSQTGYLSFSSTNLPVSLPFLHSFKQSQLLKNITFTSWLTHQCAAQVLFSCPPVIENRDKSPPLHLSSWSLEHLVDASWDVSGLVQVMPLGGSQFANWTRSPRSLSFFPIARELNDFCPRKRRKRERERRRKSLIDCFHIVSIYKCTN